MVIIISGFLGEMSLYKSSIYIRICFMMRECTTRIREVCAKNYINSKTLLCPLRPSTIPNLDMYIEHKHLQLQ